VIDAPRIPSGLDTPCVVLDLDRIEANGRRLAEALAARRVRLRPHVKTHKIVRLAKLQLELGATGITVGTLGEAEVMAAGGIDDIFVAYPIWAGGQKADRLRRLHDTVDLSVGVDSALGARTLGSAVAGSSRPLKVLVEVDSGGRRTGVPDPTAALEVATVAATGGLEVVGVFTHGGHSYAGPSAAQEAAHDEVSSLRAAADCLRDAGFPIATLSAGSTPTQLLAATSPVTEIRSGTYLLGDRQQWALGAIPDDGIGAVVAATVVSAPARGRFVVDAGAKTLTKDRAEFLDGFGLLPAFPGATIERISDYHGVVRLPEDATPPAIGQTVSVVPNHICPVINLFDTVIVLRGGRVVDTWPVDARGRNG
jgi:D-serine deaminase-like pyridoxal phosphate-dependent protein